ncbi:MAG TPA: DUF6193 family natural product biosynthesis protein [Actinocrinis sp.]|uniref:DUF6193 family natural product biosynthesis protein n=1 Tax=Actinocrinis sp. TaxID=1920516 RepID=UPI002DDD99DD|nr:DUF6193 family natural product biosynthesis protein [Actinocrinis sp.]HEV2345635.1 DUF6193 family natural product biosynthesis protein [Actinocrinis sp.]
MSSNFSQVRREPSFADPDLYPDVAEAGSLAAALTSVASELGLSLGEVLTNDLDPYRSAGVESLVPDRKPSWIILGSVERWFIFSGWWQGVELITGSTVDLGEMARALDAWRSGAKIREIHEAATFVKVSELAEAHELGSADAVTVKWRRLLEHLRQDMDRLELARSVLALAEAAFDEPKLRQLYPFTSHWSLHFTTCTGFPFSWDVPFVDPLSDRRYLVSGPSRGTVVGEADTPKDAVAMVVAGLPENCGPAVAGTADDPR